jgi:hypothetical protein
MRAVTNDTRSQPVSGEDVAGSKAHQEPGGRRRQRDRCPIKFQFGRVPSCDGSRVKLKLLRIGFGASDFCNDRFGHGAIVEVDGGDHVFDLREVAPTWASTEVAGTARALQADWNWNARSRPHDEGSVASSRMQTIDDIYVV